MSAKSKSKKGTKRSHSKRPVKTNQSSKRSNGRSKDNAPFGAASNIPVETKGVEAITVGWMLCCLIQSVAMIVVGGSLLMLVLSTQSTQESILPFVSGLASLTTLTLSVVIAAGAVYLPRVRKIAIPTPIVAFGWGLVVVPWIVFGIAKQLV